MTETELSDKHRNILKVLREHPRSRLRDIHDEIVAIDSSEFGHSPEFGDGWNNERREIRSVIGDLNDRGLVTNDYQQWYLTKKGRDILA